MNSNSAPSHSQPEENPDEAINIPIADATPPAPVDTIDTAAADVQVERQIRAMSRRSFLWSAAALGSGYSGWRWLISRRDEDGVPWPFRRALQTNEELARDYFRTTRLSPTFPKSQISPLRVNGDVGLSEDFEPSTWTMYVEGLANPAGS